MKWRCNMDLYEKIDKVNELVGIDAKLSYLDALINKETNNFYEIICIKLYHYM